MHNPLPSNIKILNFGLATFVIAFPTMILLYRALV